jgi:hypothetical protein
LYNRNHLECRIECTGLVYSISRYLVLNPAC